MLHFQDYLGMGSVITIIFLSEITEYNHLVQLADYSSGPKGSEGDCP